MKRLLALAALLVFAVPAAAARLPVVAPQDAFPLFAPDSEHLAYQVSAGRTFRLYVTDAVTRRTVAIGSSASSQLMPSWSADGTLAYTSGGVLYMANADGSGKRRYPAPAGSLAPVWRPGTQTLSYVTRSGDLRVGDAVWAHQVIGAPTWSPDGSSVGYAREGGIFVATGPAVERQVAQAVTEPRFPAYAPDGTQIAYEANNRVFVVPALGSVAPAQVAGPFTNIGPLAWAPASDALAYTTSGGVELSIDEPSWHTQLLVKGAVGVGTSFAPADPHGRVLAYAGAIPGCPGHRGILQYEGRRLAGSCAVAGTARADVIYGTPLWGDVISGGAGSDRIHANDGHTDTVLCGPGRDTVWADRSDRLRGCEIVHR